jgi:cytochrome P450
VTTTMFGSEDYCLDPYPFYEQIHQGSRVYKVPGREDYLITHYEDVVFVAKHPELFSSRLREDGFEVDGRQCAYVRPVPKYDNPEHGPIRALAGRAFTASRLRAYEPIIQSIVNALIDEFVGKGTVEFITEFSQPLPMTVICTALGFPLERIDDYRRWSSDYTVVQSGYYPSMTDLQIVEVKRSVMELQEFLGDQIAARTNEPTSDVLSEVIHSQADSGVNLSRLELMGIALSLLIAGNETTTHMLGNLMHRLVTNPSQMQAAVECPEQPRKFIEESLRIDTPAQWFPRTCVRDREIGGVTIPAGARVLLAFGAANRDQDVFPDAATFSSNRDNLNRQLAFGSGPHFCLGAPLARLEGKLAFTALLTRLPNLRLDPNAPEPTYAASIAVRSLAALHLCFDAR